MLLRPAPIQLLQASERAYSYPFNSADEHFSLKIYPRGVSHLLCIGLHLSRSNHVRALETRQGGKRYSATAREELQRRGLGFCIDVTHKTIENCENLIYNSAYYLAISAPLLSCLSSPPRIHFLRGDTLSEPQRTSCMRVTLGHASNLIFFFLSFSFRDDGPRASPRMQIKRSNAGTQRKMSPKHFFLLFADPALSVPFDRILCTRLNVNSECGCCD